MRLTDSKYQQWSGGFVLALIMAALGIGFVGVVFEAHRQRERADYWKEIAVDLAMEHGDDAVLDAAERGR